MSSSRTVLFRGVPAWGNLTSLYIRRHHVQHIWTRRSLSSSTLSSFPPGPQYQGNDKDGQNSQYTQYVVKAEPPESLNRASLFEAVSRRGKKFNSIDKRHATGLVILATSRYADLLDNESLIGLVDEAIRARVAGHLDANTEVDVVVAAVDSLPPDHAVIPFSNHHRPAEGFAFLHGRRSELFPSVAGLPVHLQEPPDLGSSPYSSSSSSSGSIAFQWPQKPIAFEFESIQSAITAVHDLKNNSKGFQIKFQSSPLEQWHSAGWHDSVPKRVPTVPFQKHMAEGYERRTLVFSGLPPTADSSDVAFLVRGRSLERLHLVPGRHAEVTFTSTDSAKSYYKNFMATPGSLILADTQLKLHVGRPLPRLSTKTVRALRDEGACRHVLLELKYSQLTEAQALKMLSAYGPVKPVISDRHIVTTSGTFPGLSLTVPLANTLFRNGKHTTMTVSRWRLKADCKSWEMLACETRNNVTVNVPAPINKCPRFVESARAVPLTLPRRIASGMGNIVRQLEFEDSGPGPASKELEENVDSYLAVVKDTDRSQFVAAGVQGSIGVWALIVPDHLSSEFVKTSPTKLSFDTSMFSGLLHYQQDQEALDTKSRPSSSKHRKCMPGFSLGYWISRGAILCRVISGGGGWGAKQGLLSLDPERVYTTGDDSSSDFESWMNKSIEKQQESALGSIAQPGSYIQFFTISPDKVQCPKLSNLGAHGHDYLRGTVFGTSPSTIDDMPDIPSEQDQMSQAQLHLVDGLFGAVSESGLYIKHKTVDRTIEASGHGTPREQIVSKLDMPYTYIVQNYTQPTSRGPQLQSAALYQRNQSDISPKGKKNRDTTPEVPVTKNNKDEYVSRPRGTLLPVIRTYTTKSVPVKPIRYQPEPIGRVRRCYSAMFEDSKSKDEIRPCIRRLLVIKGTAIADDLEERPEMQEVARKRLSLDGFME